MSSSALRLWRTVFKTLKTNYVESRSLQTVDHHLEKSVLSQSEYLVAAVEHLPPDELASDLKFLLELARTRSYFRSAGVSLHTLLNFVLEMVKNFQGDLVPSRNSVYGGMCEVLKIAFALINENYSGDAYFPVDIWKSIVEALRKVMDTLSSESLLLEDNSVAMFYVELLNFLHMVLEKRKEYLAEHVAGFVKALRMFFRYGLVNKPSFMNHSTSLTNRVGSTNQNMPVEVSNQPILEGPYRSPHVRIRMRISQEHKDKEPRHDLISSDSDCNDNNGSVMDKARLAAIICVQDLCQADPKLFTAQWTMLFPTDDVLLHRKYDTTLMSCLLSDPSLEVRIAAAHVVMKMLDGPASISLNFSSSLEHILMQLHSGTLYLIKHEPPTDELWELSFEILRLLIAFTPYSSMPDDELLSKVISSVQSTIKESFPRHNNQNNLLVVFSCLTKALSVSASVSVNNMLLGEIPRCLESGVLYILFRYSKEVSNPYIQLEALKALRSLSRNYPDVPTLCCEQISSIITHIQGVVPKLYLEQAIEIEIITAAVEVLDACLRAVSGFEGTDLSYHKSLDSPCTSEYAKTMASSSAPSYNMESPVVSTIDDSKRRIVAHDMWLSETGASMDKHHIPILIHHSNEKVKAAAVTCFCGLTIPVFSSLSENSRIYIIESILHSSVDGDNLVRSAACEAIGAIACFPDIYFSTNVVNQFNQAVLANKNIVQDHLLVTWALANLCDLLSRQLDFVRAVSGGGDSADFTVPLLKHMLWVAEEKDDEAAVHAFRGIVNLARSIQFTEQFRVPGCNFLAQLVRILCSCAGNKSIEIQENACLAFSSLFSNKSVKVQDEKWSLSVFVALLSLLKNSSVRIRIKAAAALAVPDSINGYGNSYIDVLKTVVEVRKSFKSDQTSEPSNFYQIPWKKQLTSTMLHLLGLASGCDDQRIQKFLAQEASFLEVWIQGVCSSLEDASNSIDVAEDEKKEVILRRIQSLLEVYKSSNHPPVELASSLR